MTEVRVPAYRVKEVFPVNPLNWLTRAAVYDVTCGQCRQAFTGRLHFMMGTPRENIPPSYGVRCPHCRAFNELSVQARQRRHGSDDRERGEGGRRAVIG